MQISFAQTDKILHQSFFIEDINRVELVLFDDAYELISWSGNTILTETIVSFSFAPSYVLEFYIDKKHRYEIRDSVVQNDLYLVSADLKRDLIIYKSVECDEEVSTKIYLPDSFVEISENVFEKRNSNRE